MKTNTKNSIRTAISSITAFTLLAGSSVVLAQDQPPGPPPADNQQQGAPPNGGWRRAGDQPPQPAEAAPRATMDPNYSQSGQAPQAPNQQNPNQQYPNQYPNQQYPQAGSNYDQRPVPSKLTIKPGTFVTVRLNQGLSSDRNQPGDGFAGYLSKTGRCGRRGRCASRTNGRWPRG